MKIFCFTRKKSKFLYNIPFYSDFKEKKLRMDIKKTMNFLMSSKSYIIEALNIKKYFKDFLNAWDTIQSSGSTNETMSSRDNPIIGRGKCTVWQIEFFCCKWWCTEVQPKTSLTRIHNITDFRKFGRRRKKKTRHESSMKTFTYYRWPVFVMDTDFEVENKMDKKKKKKS